MNSLDPGSSATRDLPAPPLSERWHAALSHRLEGLPVRTAIVLPGGERLGCDPADVTMRLTDHRQLALLAAGQMGRLAEEHVEGRLGIDGALRSLMDLAAALIPQDPTQPSGLSRLSRWRMSWRTLSSVTSSPRSRTSMNRRSARASRLAVMNSFTCASGAITVPMSRPSSTAPPGWVANARWRW